MENNLKSITLGLRHRRSFEMHDITGKFIDRVLYKENTPFSPEIFTKVADLANRGKFLGSEKGDSFIIDVDSFIIGIQTESLLETMEKIKEVYFPFLKELIGEFNVENFNRVGIIFEYKFVGSSLINKMVKDFTLNDIDSPEQIELAFNKKLPANKAILKRNIGDFYNVIATYRKDVSGLNVKLDYQLYFEPEVASIDDVYFDEFIKKTLKYLKENFCKWNKVDHE